MNGENITLETITQQSERGENMTKDWIDYISQVIDPVNDNESNYNDESNDEYYGLQEYKEYCELWT